jgi:hypothetical protein
MRPRLHPLRNPTQPLAYRQNEPEYGLMVWCGWRVLLKGKSVLTSEGCENDPRLLEQVNKLSGLAVGDVDLVSDFGDVRLYFGKGFQLDIVCDRAPRSSGLDENWELFHYEALIAEG